MNFKELVIGDRFTVPIDAPLKPDDPEGTEKKCIFTKTSDSQAIISDTIFRDLGYLIGKRRSFDQDYPVERWEV